MNKQEADILKAISMKPFHNQRILAEETGHSLGIVNRSLKNLLQGGFINNDMKPTDKAKKELSAKSPKNAIILAAGFGMRMVPINTQTPKALMEIKGEVLIERIIRQLHEVNIKEIYVVVGYMKDRFEYLIDEFGVELIINEIYSEKNNLHSLNLAAKYLSNSYIIPCDIWCCNNPYSMKELYSWYMINSDEDFDSTVDLNRKGELEIVKNSGKCMIGIAYLVEKDAEIVRKRLDFLDRDRKYNDTFWEECIIDGRTLLTYARVINSSDYVEINTYEQLREFDQNSSHLKSNELSIIADSLNVKEMEINEIKVLKKGMTNRSFMFCCRGKKYIMRVPGEGTENLINRKQEATVYDAIKEKGLCDNPIYINEDNGYKLTEYLSGARVCDSNDEQDLRICMKKLREFHQMNIQVSHTFNLYEQIDFYESLWEGVPSIYKDYESTKHNVFLLKDYIENNIEMWCLSHIDAVPDNFLFYEGGMQLTDWEYAGMQDPHVDIAMFAIYSLYDKAQIDHLIDLYFGERCKDNIRIKIYCYIAVCGLLWSNWCEYKRNLGIEFGEYSLRQYRYAKEYYKVVMDELRRLEEEKNEGR